MSLLIRGRPCISLGGMVTWTLSGETVHFVHFRFESGVNLDGESVVSLDSCWTVSDQITAAARSTSATRGTTALSFTWSTAEAALVSAGWTFVGVMLAFTTFACTRSVVVTAFEILARSITWLAASNVACTRAKTSLPTSSAKIIIPVQASASNTSTLGILMKFYRGSRRTRRGRPLTRADSKSEPTILGDIFSDFAGKSRRGK